jgi:hypothetical protein
VFQSRFPDLQTKFVKWNSRKINERAIYVATFDTEKWRKLPTSKKAEHSLLECRGCSQRYSYQQSLFPVKCNQLKNIQKEIDFAEAAQTVRDVCHAKVKCTKREVTKTARELYTRINSQFEKACQVPLAEALVSVPELQLQQQKSKAQMKKERRDQYRKAKKRVEEEWKETEIIRLVCF